MQFFSCIYTLYVILLTIHIALSTYCLLLRLTRKLLELIFV